MDNNKSKSTLSVISMDTLNTSSTTKLAEPRKGSLKSQYDPFENRDVEHPNTWPSRPVLRGMQIIRRTSEKLPNSPGQCKAKRCQWGTGAFADIGALAHLLKSSLGTGVLAMPNAFNSGGLAFGMVGTIVVGIVCTHCVHILVKSSHILCKRQKIPSLGFAETAEEAFRSGPPSFQRKSDAARKFVNGALMATYYSALCVYVVFVAESVQQVTNHYLGEADELPIRVFVPMLLLPLIPLALIRNLKYLVPFSALANVFICISFAITLYYMFSELPNPNDRDLIASVGSMPMFFSTVIFAMEGIGVVMPLENSMRNPGHFLGYCGVLNIAMSVVVTLYAVIGFVGYIKYGKETEGSVTLNLPKDEVLAQVAKLMYAAAIFFSYGLQFYIPMSITWPHLDGKFSEKWRNTAQNLFRMFVVTVTVAVATAIPKLGPIISLVGAVCFSTLGLFCPAMIETVTCWEGGLGWGRWRLWKNCIIMLCAIIALLTGTYTSILEMIETFSEKE